MDHSNASALGRGFADPVMDAQRCFRAILAAMAEPGTVHVLGASIEPPSCLTPAAATALLALADHDTPIWLQPQLADGAGYLRFHTGAPLARARAAARFAVVDGAGNPELSTFDQGEDRYPDRSATVIIQCAGLTGGKAVELAGPGIRGRRTIAPRGISGGFWVDVADNGSRYPLGVDLMLAAGPEIMCLPRSIRVVGSADCWETD